MRIVSRGLAYSLPANSWCVAEGIGAEKGADVLFSYKKVLTVANRQLKGA